MEEKEPLLGEAFGDSAQEDKSKKRSKKLAQVRDLLEWASRSDTSAEEAEVCRIRANAIMTRFAIEEWEARTEEKGIEMPEMRLFDYSWWGSSQFSNQLSWMFREMCKHCRCYSVMEKIKFEGKGLTIPVVGLPSDIDWLDLLFTNVMIFMIDRVDPRAMTDLSVNDNMARMREAGMPWGDAINRLVFAGIVKSIAEEEWQKEPYNIDIGRRKKPDPTNKRRLDGRGKQYLYFSKSTYEKTITSYRRWCAETGREQSKVSQVTFRRHFANGFAAEVNDRMYRMRKSTESAYDSEHEAGSMAIAIRDIEKIVEEAVFLQFPDLRPHPSGCNCDNCHWCHDANCDRPNCVARRDWNPIRTRSRAPKPEKVDWAAQDAGRSAGRSVQLSNNPDKRIGGQKELI